MMSNVKLVTGAGPVGWTVAEQLVRNGDRVRILTRSGSGPEHPLVERISADVSDAAQLESAMHGVSAVFHCIHGSKYSAEAWRRELPEAEQVILAAAHRTGAVVVFPESLYSYSTPAAPMTEDSPRTATGGKRGVRTELLAARAAAQTATVSVVASDFYGPWVRAAHAGERMVPRALAGKTIRVLGSANTPHSFTYVPDLAAAMIKAAAKKEVWNRVLHAPTGPAVTQGQMAEGFARAAGVQTPRVSVLPGSLLRALGVVSADIRELAEMLYQFEAPFVMNSSRTESLLGLAATPLSEGANATVDWWRGLATDSSAGSAKGVEPAQ